MREPKRRGKITISAEGLASLLHLREGLAVISVRWRHDYESLEIILAGDSLQVTPRRNQIVEYALADLMNLD
jgi:hypothetical protein